MGISGGPREYHVYIILSHLAHSDDVGALYTYVACEDIDMSWRHLLTNCAAAILSTGLMPKTLSPTWNGSKLSTRRFVASQCHLFPLLFNLCLYHKGGVGDFGHELTDILLLQTGLGSRPPSTAEVPQTTAT